MAPPAATVLACRGGGYMGYFSASLLCRLDQFRAACGAAGDFADSIDAFAGTSVGSIIAGSLAARKSPQRIREIMDDAGNQVFPRRRILHRFPGVFRARFSAGPLQEILEGELNGTRLGDLDKVLVIPAVNETTGLPHLFKSSDPRQEEELLSNAILASAAAPLFLPRHKIGDHYYADGALVSNGPALLAALELKRTFGIEIARQNIIAIGTTTAPADAHPSADNPSWGLWHWLIRRRRLTDLLLAGNVDLQTQMLFDLGPSKFVPLDQELDAARARLVDLVDASPEAKSVLSQAADDLADGLSPTVRDELETLLVRRARVLAFAELAGSGDLSPVLQEPDGPGPGVA